MSDPRPAIQRDWLSKSLAGTLLGLGLGVALIGLFIHVGPGGVDARGDQHLGRYMLMRWLVPPIWAGVLSFVFLFRSGMRAWLWLGAANLLTFGLLLACRLKWIG